MQNSLIEDLSETGGQTLRNARDFLANANQLLSPDNRQAISRTLANLEAVSGESRVNAQQLREVLSPHNMRLMNSTLLHIDKTTAQAAPLLADARALVVRLQSVSERMDTTLSEQTSGNGLIPRLNDLSADLSSSSRQLNRVLQMLEDSPQSLIFGRPKALPGPGEPGFVAPASTEASHEALVDGVRRAGAGRLCGGDQSAPPAVELRFRPAGDARLANGAWLWGSCSPSGRRRGSTRSTSITGWRTTTRSCCASMRAVAGRVRRASWSRRGWRSSSARSATAVRAAARRACCASICTSSRSASIPHASSGVVQGSVSVFDARRRLLGERRFAVEQPAARADAPGGAQALMLASNEFGRQIADWLDALENRDAALKRCRAVGAGG